MNSEDENSGTLIGYWKIINDPMIALFKNLEYAEENLDTIMRSLINSNRDFSGIIVPQNTTEETEKQYCTFDKWLLNRLFYILTQEKLHKIHHLSIKAQLKILSILFINETSFYEDLHSEYINTLEKLVKHYYLNQSESNNNNMEIHFLFSGMIDMSSVNLDLSPIIIYINDINICKSVIESLLDIISQLIIHTNDFQLSYNNEKLILEVLFILENFNVELKCKAINFFNKIIEHFGFNIYNELFYKVLNFIEIFILNLPILMNFTNTFHFKQISELNYQLSKLLTTLRLLNVTKDIDLNSCILSICKAIIDTEKKIVSNINYKNNIQKLLSDDSYSIFNAELKESCFKLLENYYIIDTIHFNSIFNISTYIREIPSFYLSLLISEINIKLILKEITYDNTIEFYNKSMIFQDIISTLKDILETVNDICIEKDKIEVNLKSCCDILNIIQKFEIEFHNKYQIQNGIFDYLYDINKEVEKNDCQICKKYIQLKLIPSDLITFILKSIISILKTHRKKIETSPDLIIICIEIVMSTLMLSYDITLSDIFILLQIECFSLYNELEVLEKFSYEIFMQKSYEKIHIHSLKKLLGLKFAFNNFKNDSELNNTIVQILESFDLKNIDYHVHILEYTPLLILNGILPPHQVLKKYIFTAIISPNKKLLDSSIKILPIIMCILHGHYAIIRSKIHREHQDFEYNLISINNLYFGLICLHCSKSVHPFCVYKSSKSELINSRVMIIVEKSKLMYSNINNLLKNLKIFFEKILKNLLIYDESLSISSLLLTFSRHSILIPTNISLFWSENNLLNLSKIFQSFITNVMNDKTIENELKNSIINSSVNILLKSTKNALEMNDNNKQNICLNAIYQFGISQCEQVVLPSIKLLTYFLMYPNTPYASRAAFCVRSICESHNTLPNIIYHKYKKDLCRIMMEMVAYNYLLAQPFTTSIFKVIRAYGFINPKEFTIKEIYHAIPYLIPLVSKSKDLRGIIPEIASLIPSTSSDFINERFCFIFTHIYLYESDENSKYCYNYIQEITGSTLVDLINRHFRIILNELLIQYCNGKEKVIKACKWLANTNTNFSPLSPDTSLPLTEVANFIQPRFLGVLAFFDNKMVHNKIALSVKRKAIQSLPLILNLMGPVHMTPLKFKILATLRTALLSVKEYPEYNAEAWNSFIRNIDTAAIGPLLPTIFVSLMPLIPHVPDKINAIFEYLVLSNENILSSYLVDLFFIEEANISNKIKTVIAKHVAKRMPNTFIEKIKWYMKYLSQDTVEIKIYTLKYLNKLMISHRSDLDIVIFGSKNIDPAIIELLEILITDCRNKDTQLADWSGRCLGQLGALQPSLLPRETTTAESLPFVFNLENLSFVKIALNELIRAFQAEKHTKDMDCYSLAIQEILNIYNISPNGPNKEIWDNFPDHFQQIMQPLLSSRYNVGFPTIPIDVHPVFGSKHGANFNEWAYNWAGQLIELIDKNNIQNLLKMVQPAMKKDVRILILFLPYIILHAVFASSDFPIIKGEFSSIIELESFGNESRNKFEPPKHKIMRNLNLTPNMTPVYVEEGTHIKCCKMLYNFYDFLHRWLWEWCYIKKNSRNDPDYLKIKDFTSHFCKLTIAQGNFLCGELERALFYLEMYMEDSPNHLKEQLGFLAEIYAVLNEPDAVSGIMSMKQNEPSLSELILAHEVTGQLQDAAICYEKYAQLGNIENDRLQGMVEIYLGLDQPYTALKLLQGADDLDFGAEAMAAEPFWRLGMFEELDKLLKQPDVSNDDRWGVRIGHCLLALRNGERDLLQEKLQEARFSLLHKLNSCVSYTSAKENIYSRAYLSTLGLHMISEIEHAEDSIYTIKKSNKADSHYVNIIDNLINDWNLRLKFVQSSVNTIEPILRLRRILLEQSKKLLEETHPETGSLLDMHIGKLWLQSAKFARKASIFQQAYIYILNGERYIPKEIFIEKAKLYWMKGEQEPAFCTLKRGLEEHFPDVAQLSPSDRKLCAKAKLLIAVYNDENINVDMDVNIIHYKDAVDVYKQWEKSLVCLGGYYERVYAALNNNDKKGVTGGSARMHALNSYGLALQYGHSKIYQSIPRMLSIWLDFEMPTNENKKVAIATLMQICSMIETFTERLPLYLFLTAFSQIISRICHPVKEVYVLLKSIIIKLIIAYPQHSLWMMMCVIKSSYPQRIERCQDILNDPRLNDASIQKFIRDFNLLAEKLIELCNNPISSKVQKTYVSNLVKALPKILSSEEFSQIVMPHEKFVKMILPFNSGKGINDFNYNPFPSLVYISGIEDEIVVLPSLQKPRKVTFIGSDGKKYIIMLKPKDDLRKDFRLMEFNAIVNRYLQENSEARERRLYIRTYTVLPLNEECGIIEWIPNLVGLRAILTEIYKDKGLHMTSKELKQVMCSKDDTLAKKREVFEKHLLPRHPPVFAEWFRFTFSDPHSWYQARSAYIRTTAVMSMVGYILGLGDRHGENILFDSINGDTVHVDFNCLFNMGEEFQWPERVPFRLTHNMQSAMGPLGYEGMFRKCCSITMRVLRSQTTTLMSVVRPFVYDPLVEWQKSINRKDANVTERTNQSACDHLVHIEQRLQGMVHTKNKQFSLSLSPEGQVNNLILEATNVVNLCQMYIGWGSYL